MRIKTFENFKDPENYENEIYNLPLSQRQELKELLTEMPVKNEANIFREIKTALTSFLRKKAIDWLINLSEKELNEQIEHLTVLDPQDFSNIDKCQVIYLGGPIDKTSKAGATEWRELVEDTIGEENHVLKGNNMLQTAKTGKLHKSGLKYPIIVNPWRNELVRKDDPRFQDVFNRWKTGELNEPGAISPDDWKYWAKKTNQQIAAGDRRLVAVCDTNLVYLNRDTGGGTYGEIELGTLGGINNFIWLNNGYKIQDISPWLIPGVKKIVRNMIELQNLLGKIIEINA